MITAGGYKGKAVKGKTQLGETETGTLQIAIDMALKNSSGELVGTMTTFLYFTDKSAVYSFERLRALGWKGNGAEDIDKLDDIYENEVPCTVEAPSSYKDPKTGENKMGTPKLTIDTGAGTVTLNKPLTADTFKARLRALGGSSGGSAPATSGGGGTAPPF
jgi:hypothetical protein